MDYIFQFGPMDAAALLPQVSRALEKRTELISRGKYPALWKHTGPPEDGLYAGGPAKARRLRTKVLGAACLTLGAVLFIPGLMRPRELAVPLAAGAVSICFGAGELWRGRKNRKNPFDESARLLLESMDRLPHGQTVRAVFSPVGMVLVEGEEARTILYHEVEYVIEGEDMFLITFNGQAAVLQKRDLEGSVEGFLAFLADKTTLV